jgi:hypothetical protein
MRGASLPLGRNQMGLNRDPNWAALAGDHDTLLVGGGRPAFMN